MKITNESTHEFDSGYMCIKIKYKDGKPSVIEVERISGGFYLTNLRLYDFTDLQNLKDLIEEVLEYESQRTMGGKQ